MQLILQQRNQMNAPELIDPRNQKYGHSMFTPIIGQSFRNFHTIFVTLAYEEWLW